MRIILQDNSHALSQLEAALQAIKDGIKPGDLWGFVILGRGYGVKCNPGSVRVYRNEDE